MRDQILVKLAELAARRTGLMLALALALTVVAAGLAGRLKLTMHFKNLMPQAHPMVQEFNRIVDDYRTASMIIIAARGEEHELKRFADELAPELEAMTAYVQRVDYKLERDFFLAHGFMLQRARNLENSKAIYRDLSLLPMLTRLNDSFEKTYVYDEESLSTKEKERDAVAFLDGIQYWLETMSQYAAAGVDLSPEVAAAAVERFLIGDTYMISQDKDMLLLFAQPTFTVNEIDRVIEAENAVDALIARVAEKYPGIHAGTTGTMALARDETVAANEDMYLTSLLAFALIIALFVISFRMWVAPLLAGACLLIGVIWTAGFAALTVGSLNIMTSMFSVILIGLGIDFSVHLISVYTESRAAGQEVDEALQQALLKSGKGVMTGALTTACAFLTLLVSSTAGMSEFGLVAGSGVVCCMLATLWVLPAMLALRDKMLVRLRGGAYRARSTSFAFLGRSAQAISQRPISVLLAGLVVTALLFYAALNITFDYNYLNMEPAGLTSIKLQNEMEAEFDMTPDFALITAPSVEASRRISEAAKDLGMIGMVTSISEYIPSQNQQQRRARHIREIREFLTRNRTVTPLSEDRMGALFEELSRLEDNVIELAQLAYLGGQDKVDAKCKAMTGDLEDPDRKGMIPLLVNALRSDLRRGVENLNVFQAHYTPQMREMALGMASTDPITVESLPQNIVDRFASQDGQKFLVTIYPVETVWHLQFLERFTRQMQELDERVTGMPLVFYVLIQIIGQDGKTAAWLTLVVIFLLLFWDFRSLRFTALAMTPLIVGAIWMVGTMQLLGLQLTLVNVMGLPLILGIGIDDGVHVLHRYGVEGAGRIGTVFTSTGKAILLTSLTTMLAFGSLVFATYRGLGSLGIALFIGVGTCFLTSAVVLPALLGVTEKREEDAR